jgi:hypothetical protein
MKRARFQHVDPKGPVQTGRGAFLKFEFRGARAAERCPLANRVNSQKSKREPEANQTPTALNLR